MIKKDPDTGENILDVDELIHLRKARSLFRNDKKNTLLQEEYFIAAIAFLDWFMSYADTIIKGKVYADNIIAQNIFATKFRSKKQYQEHIRCNLYVAKEFVDYLHKEITSANIHRYEHAITGLEIDLEELVADIEVNYKETVTDITRNSYRRKNLDPSDLYSAATDLFFIEKRESLADLYLRDLKPAVMFQVRQLLEVYGRNVLGYFSIIDNKGEPVKKFTQVAWEFIKEESIKTDSRIEIPFDIDLIISINTWANSFVHTTYIYSSYIQFFALKAISVLFEIEKDPIMIYNGKRSIKNVPAIKITGYKSLQSDFENYLRKRNPKVSVRWMDVSKVGAYIISL
jgi:hypothetical protein